MAASKRAWLVVGQNEAGGRWRERERERERERCNENVNVFTLIFLAFFEKRHEFYGFQCFISKRQHKIPFLTYFINKQRVFIFNGVFIKRP